MLKSVSRDLINQKNIPEFVTRYFLYKTRNSERFKETNPVPYICKQVKSCSSRSELLDQEKVQESVKKEAERSSLHF